MKRSDIYRIIFVTLLLIPLIYVQTGPDAAPAWMDERIGGVPITVIAVTLWFIAMMTTAVVFASQQAAENLMNKEGE